MKKILKTLLMLTGVLMLTACGSEETITEHQQEKIDVAKIHSEYMIFGVSEMVKSGASDEWLAKYNNIELGDEFEDSVCGLVKDVYKLDYECEVDGKGIRSAVTSFQSAFEEIGTIQTMGEMKAKPDGDTIIINVPVVCENGEGEVELIFTNDIYCEMTACTLNINETMSDMMIKAALNTLIGMGTVFVVLILISLIIACFGFIPKIQAMFAKKEDTASVVEPIQEVVEETEEELADDMELVAVIAAAIAAYEGTSADGFQVRSIKRANTKKWQRA